MKKSDVLKAVAGGGVKGKLAEKRIAATKEFRALSDQDEITSETLLEWIDGRPTGLHCGGNLSDADLRVVERILGRQVAA